VEGVTYSPPHIVATVELDEQSQLRFTAGVLTEDQAGIAIGDRVELDWVERNGRPLPVWRPAVTG